MKNKKINLKNSITVKRSHSKTGERPLTDLEKELETAIRADSLLKEKEYKTVIKELRNFLKKKSDYHIFTGKLQQLTILYEIFIFPWIIFTWQKTFFLQSMNTGIF